MGEDGQEKIRGPRDGNELPKEIRIITGACGLVGAGGALLNQIPVCRPTFSIIKQPSQNCVSPLVHDFSGLYPAALVPFVPILLLSSWNKLRERHPNLFGGSDYHR